MITSNELVSDNRARMIKVFVFSVVFTSHYRILFQHTEIWPGLIWASYCLPHTHLVLQGTFRPLKM